MPIRLQGSSLPNAGRIEILYTGVCGAIRSYNWDIKDVDDASKVCRKLDYQAGAETALRNEVYGPFSSPAWQSNLQCTGNKRNVMGCCHDEIGNNTERYSSKYFARVSVKTAQRLQLSL